MKKYLLVGLSILLGLGLSFASNTQTTDTLFYYRNDITNTFHIFEGEGMCLEGTDTQCMAYDYVAGPVWIYTAPHEMAYYLTDVWPADQ